MHIPDHLLPWDVLLVAHGMWFLTMVQAFRQAPWRQFYRNRLPKVFLAAVVLLLWLWSFDATINPGLGFHFLGTTVFTLMFGWSLGVIGVSLVTLGSTWQWGGAWETLSLNALLFGVLPVSVSFGIYRIVHLYLPHHVFIYIYLCAFGGAIVAAAIAVSATVYLLIASGTYTLARISGEYLPFLPLYLFPEGVLNGMLATVFVALRPQWLKTFDDHSYLSG
jgi:uncharacterized membrane protein